MFVRLLIPLQRVSTPEFFVKVHVYFQAPYPYMSATNRSVRIPLSRLRIFMGVPKNPEICSSVKKESISLTNISSQKILIQFLRDAFPVYPFYNVNTSICTASIRENVHKDPDFHIYDK